MEKVNVKTTKTTAARRRANKKYDENNMKSYTVAMPLSVYNVMCAAFGDTMEIKNRNAYTIQAVREKLERDGYL